MVHRGAFWPCALLKASLTELKAQGENQLVPRRVSSGERRRGGAVGGTGHMGDSFGNRSVSKAVYTIWTSKNRPCPKMREKMIQWQQQLGTFPFTRLEKSSGRNFLTARTENLYVTLFQVNFLAEIKIWSTLPSTRDSVIAQKLFLCRMRVIS